MTEPTPPPRRTAAQIRKDKADALTLATEILSNRVGTLADAVQMNNYKIDRLQKEVNCKPDDTEVRFITGMAKAERTKHLKYAIATGAVTAALSSVFTYVVIQQSNRNDLIRSNQVSYSGCKAANERSFRTAEGFIKVANLVPPDKRGEPLYKSLTETSRSLNELIRDCEGLYPKEDR